MSFFKNLKTPVRKENNIQSNITNLNWLPLTSEKGLREIVKLSEQKPCVIFKHSTRCSISTMAISRLERNWEGGENSIDFYYLDLIQYRSVSNLIADMFGVKHESPQVLLIEKGRVVYHTSHNGITAEGLKSNISLSV